MTVNFEVFLWTPPVCSVCKEIIDDKPVYKDMGTYVHRECEEAWDRKDDRNEYRETVISGPW